MGEKEEISIQKYVADKEGGGNMATSEIPSNNKIIFSKYNWILWQSPIPNLRKGGVAQGDIR